jgi:hypothetical protein
MKIGYFQRGACEAAYDERPGCRTNWPWWVFLCFVFTIFGIKTENMKEIILNKMKRQQEGYMIKLQALKYPDILHYEWEGECLERTDDGMLVWCKPGRK